MSTPKIALVTGGGSGLGRVIATALAGAGYRVVVAGRTRASLESVPGADPVVADAAAVRALFEDVADRYGRLDVLVNNAGVAGSGGPVEELSDEDWQVVVDTNLTGSFRCARAAFRLMMTQHPRGGRIINNGSISAHVPRPNAVAYTATKHAITGLTKSLLVRLPEIKSVGCVPADGADLWWLVAGCRRGPLSLRWSARGLCQATANP